MILAAALAWQVGLAACVPLLVRRFGRDAGYPLAAGYLAGAALLLSRLPVILDDREVAVAWRWLPGPEVHAALRMDALGLVFALLALGVGALIMAYCPRYLDGTEVEQERVYVTMTLFAAAMLGLVLADDLLVLFVFWELTSILSFVLIGQGGRPAATGPAVRALLVTVTGGLALLTAIVLLAVHLGTTSLDTIVAEPERLNGGPAWAVGTLVIVAAFTKSAQLPFHFWLPGAMVAITPVSAYLHAATMVKAGIYLLMRFSAVFGGSWAWDGALIVVGLLTAILGALLALRQYDLKALLAYSTVSQLGLLVGVIGVGTPDADAAAILYTVAHALFKATLFMLVGIIDHQAGSRDVRELAGLHRVMPATVWLTVLAAMSMAGLPPTIGFVGKEAIFEALGGASGGGWLGWSAAGLGVLASVLTFAYAARLVHGMVEGPTRQRQLREPSWAFLAPAAVAALVATALGPTVVVLSPLVERAADDARPEGTPPYLAFWHGFTPALGLSVLTVLLGVLMFLGRVRVDRWLRAVPTAPPFAALFERARQALLHVGSIVARSAHAPDPAPYLARPLLAAVALAAVAAVALPDVPAGLGGDPARPGDWLLLGLLVTALAGLLVARSALAAIGLTGVVGLLLSAWFLTLGAPDVALTLMLVEVLTAVVVMLALRQQPRRLAPVGRRSSVTGAALLAVATGGAAAAGTAVLTGPDRLSDPGRWYLDRAEELTGGANVVNTILVDFRALDTLGEAVVLAVVALGLVRLAAGRPVEPARTGPAGDDLVLGLAYRVLAPVMLLASAVLFLRGHEETGGGFIGALLAGTAVGLGQLAHPGGAPLLGRLRSAPLAAAGLLTATVAALVPLAARRSPLTPLTLTTPDPLPSLSTSLLFDLGIYLMVLALVVAAVRRLGVPPAQPADLPETGGAR
ncbi:hydrogen gas-evolving membrane-bound hydrogenase subunit E [Verrucosispora sp. WMMC514]|uniref:hydrogen gas-evolving membrane-bound hydrogenase subunit E n=1 Tax=Verrucosispora sp. WMMC514 TaxID=3015156 RepID=UPI00248BC270|nr:hydrogen gas-evolving membrane-bound hydrogenase subunit E [Verrucosispora sp. WMMC514]WBB91878.1 proton-conducting transporter membrane subunit [Verrucosispora sp. WMMC514]